MSTSRRIATGGAAAQAASTTGISRSPPAAQVEFYFSDSNLPKDRFLKGKVAEDPEGCECRALLLPALPRHTAALHTAVARWTDCQHADVGLKIVVAFARMRAIISVRAGGRHRGAPSTTSAQPRPPTCSMMLHARSST